MKKRELIKMKYNGLCAYTGTPLLDDWQVDHIQPKAMFKYGEDPNDFFNLVPCQRIVNHYKRALPLEDFRMWFLGELHLRLKKLPKNPRTEKSLARKMYLLEVASLFGITEDKPFSGKFYFETL